jgi:hypothetical protein
VQLALTPGFNTVQLTATPVNVTGTPLSGLGPVTYTPADSTVTVSSTGLVTARFVTQGVTQVIASLQAQKATLADTVTLQVTDTVPRYPLATFSIQPAPGDSAKRSLDFTNGFNWSPRAVNTAGDTVCDSTACSLLTYYTSSNSDVAMISKSGRITPVGVGQTVLTATTLAYGVARRDSVVFTVGYRVYYDLFIYLTTTLGVLTLGYKAPKVLLLGIGATINFVAPGCVPTYQYQGHPVDVTFDNPAAVDTASSYDPNLSDSKLPSTGNGNIPAFACDTNPQGICKSKADPNLYRSRRFPVAGTYHYHSSLYPSDTFTIIIQQQ